MVRPPAAAWDKKTKYAAIGRARNADYDDVFVISALFHHISIVRVRVPDRLLAVLDGEPDDGLQSWGKLEVRRSKWFDLFKVEDRLAAMQLLWSMMAYLMRAESGDGGEGDDDVKAEREVKKEQVGGEEAGKGDGGKGAKEEIGTTPEGEHEAIDVGAAAPPAVLVAAAATTATVADVPVISNTEETGPAEKEEEEVEKKDGQGDVEMANS